MSITFSENKYPIAKNISWNDVIKKIEYESSELVVLWNNSSLNPPTFFLRGDYYPGSIGKTFDFVSKDCGVEVMHMYTSFGRIVRLLEIIMIQLMSYWFKQKVVLHIDVMILRIH